MMEDAEECAHLYEETDHFKDTERMLMSGKNCKMEAISTSGHLNDVSSFSSRVGDVSECSPGSSTGVESIPAEKKDAIVYNYILSNDSSTNKEMSKVRCTDDGDFEVSSSSDLQDEVIHEDGEDEVDGSNAATPLRMRPTELNESCELPFGDYDYLHGPSNTSVQEDRYETDSPQESHPSEDLSKEADLVSFDRKSGSDPKYVANPNNLPYVCSQCGKGFNEKGHLKYHIRTHSDEKQYTCHVCNRGFHFSFNLTKHLRTHTGEKPYKCNFCGKSFSHKNSLNRHAMLHTGFSHHKCRICDKDFTDKQSLRKHLITHTADGENKCQICNRQFNDKRGFLIHMQSHVTASEVSAMEKALSFECDICHNTYLLKSSLNRHMKKHSACVDREIKTDDESVDSAMETELDLNDSWKLSHSGQSSVPDEFTNSDQSSLTNAALPKVDISQSYPTLPRQVMRNANMFSSNSSPEYLDGQGINLCMKPNTANGYLHLNSTPDEIKHVSDEEIGGCQMDQDEIALDLSMKTCSVPLDFSIKQEPLEIEAVMSGTTWNTHIDQHEVTVCALDLSTPKTSNRTSDGTPCINPKMEPEGSKQEICSHNQSSCELQDKMYKCKLCTKTFEDRLDLLQHRKQHQQNSFSPTFNETAVSQDLGGSASQSADDMDDPIDTKCPYCDETFASTLVLNRHLLSHFKDKIDFCEFCFRMFADKDRFKAHIEAHTGEKVYECSMCSMTFANKPEQVDHIKDHKNEKPFLCGHCDKSFPIKYYLESHMRVHFGDKPFKCQVCGRGFSHSFNLTKHVRIHTGERPYECPYCQRRFGQKNSLNRHMYLHVGDSPFSCKLCNKFFSHNFALQIHMSKIHGIIDSNMTQTELERFQKYSLLQDGVTDVSQFNMNQPHHYDDSVEYMRAAKRFCEGISTTLDRSLTSHSPQDFGQEHNLPQTSENESECESSSNEEELGNVRQGTEAAVPPSHGHLQDTVSLFNGTVHPDKYAGKDVNSSAYPNSQTGRENGSEAISSIDNMSTAGMFLPWQIPGMSTIPNFHTMSPSMAMSAYLLNSYIQAQQMALFNNGGNLHGNGLEEMESPFIKNRSIMPVSNEPKEIHRKQNASDINDDHQLPDSSVFVCHECGKSFKKRYYLKTHMRVHTGEKPFKCEICEKAFSYNFNLKKHLRTHTGEQPYQCHICNRRFSHVNSLNRHVSIHGESSLVCPCPVCGRSFPDKLALRHHIVLQHDHTDGGTVEGRTDHGMVVKKEEKENVNSEECNKVEEGIIAADQVCITKETLNGISGEKENLYYTNQTQGGSDTVDDADSASDKGPTISGSLNEDGDDSPSVKKVDNPPDRVLSNLSVEECDGDRSSQVLDPAVNRFIGQENVFNMNSKNGTCFLPNDSENDYSDDTDASQIQAKRGRKPSVLTTPLDCPMCEKVFFKKQDLKSHLKVHSYARPHQCDLCAKAFSHKSTLTNHRRIHTGEKPYSCEVCQKSFTFLSSLQRHKLLHSADSVYKCFVCGEIMEDKSSLNKHIKMHVKDCDNPPSVNTIGVTG